MFWICLFLISKKQDSFSWFLVLTRNIPCALVSSIRERLRQVHGLTTLFVQCTFYMMTQIGLRNLKWSRNSVIWGLLINLQRHIKFALFCTVLDLKEVIYLELIKFHSHHKHFLFGELLVRCVIYRGFWCTQWWSDQCYNYISRFEESEMHEELVCWKM